MQESGSVEQAFGVAMGAHLQSLRRARGLSEIELAGRTGLGADLIEAVERGESSPTLESLRCWVDAGLGMSLAGFFALLEPGPEREDEGRLVQIFRDAAPGTRRLILRIARTLASEPL